MHRHRDSFVSRDSCCGVPYGRRVLQSSPSGRGCFVFLSEVGFLLAKANVSASVILRVTLVPPPFKPICRLQG